MELTILMPCLNEAETIVSCIQKAKQFLAHHHIEGEILISDNGSHDGSQALAEEQGARVVHATERGYGAALMNGIKHAKGRYIIMGDADDSYDFANLNSFLEKLRAGDELVMGNRFKGGIKPHAMPFLNKYLGNPVLSFLGRLFFKCPVGDFHCGLRGFHREAIEKLGLHSPGMEFASEMVVKAALMNIKVTEVPTILSLDGRSRPPHLRKWSDGWRHLRLLLLFSPNWLFLYPGMLLAASGLILMFALTFGPLKLGNHVLDIHTLLFSSAFLMMGIQAMFFSLFGKVIANIKMRLPNSKGLKIFLEKFTLERGLILGLLLIFLGIIGSFLSFYIWMDAQFGILVPGQMMRLAIPSVSLLIIGMQIIFSAFFMDLINKNIGE